MRTTTKVKGLWFAASISWAVIFLLWTLGVKMVDVQAIGANGSTVGLATVNQWWQNLVGAQVWCRWYSSGLLVLTLLALGGLLAWPVVLGWRTKNWRAAWSQLWPRLCAVVCLVGGYLLFDVVVINYRPVLVAGQLVASYPSTHTLCLVVVWPLVAQPISAGWRSRRGRCLVWLVCVGLVGSGLLTRAASGLHWLTDVISSVFYGLAVVCLTGGLTVPTKHDLLTTEGKTWQQF